jgi:hypothetical protein
MIIYRFRVTSEEQEDFLREIEIQPNQTFLDFHEAIMSCADLHKCEKAFFYTTDKKYKKHQEISLKLLKKKVKKYDDELDEIITEIKTPRLMKDSRLKQYIEDPHQRMIYEFYGKESHFLNLELFKIIKTDEMVSLPRCVKSTGELPRPVVLPVVPVVAPPEEEAAIHPPLFPAVKESIFEGIHENEAEIAEIEEHLDEFLDTGDPETSEEPEKPVSIADPDEEEEYPAEEEEGKMQSLDEFEDIESLEIKHRNFGGESDEY